MVAVSGVWLTHAAVGLYTGLASLGREFPPQVCRGASKKKTKTSCVISLLGERIKWEVFCRERLQLQRGEKRVIARNKREILDFFE